MSEGIFIAVIGGVATIVAAWFGYFGIRSQNALSPEARDDAKVKKLLKRQLKDKRFSQRKLSTLKEKTKVYDHERLRRLLRDLNAEPVTDPGGDECWTLKPRK